jgi:hypothetical protein
MYEKGKGHYFAQIPFHILHGHPRPVLRIFFAAIARLWPTMGMVLYVFLGKISEEISTI